MANLEDEYWNMNESQLKNAYDTSAGLHKKIIEKVLEERREEFSMNDLTEVSHSTTIADLMERLKQNNLDNTARNVAQKSLLERYDEVEQYIYEKLSTGNYSHKLVDPLELYYRLSLINIQKLSESVRVDRGYEALSIFQKEVKIILDIYEILLSHYNNINDNMRFFKYFNSERMKKYDYELLNITKEEGFESDPFDSDELQDDLSSLGYSSKHWLFKKNIINTCEYLFNVLRDLIEPNYEYKNYEIIHDFTDTMTPEEYESYCATILDENGWEASVTKTTGDQGADVIGRKNGISIIIQCKLYSSPVGNKAVQEVHAALSHYSGTYGIVVTNNTFTQSAIELANSTNTILVHHDELAEILNKLVPSEVKS